MTAGNRPSRPRPRAVERLLMTVAMVALGWYAGIRLGAAIDYSADEHAFERMRVAAAIPLPAAERARPAHTARRAVPGTPGILGRIEVPRVGLSAMVREGTDARTLRRAVGHISNTALPGAGGNVVLAGHRDTFFRPLKDVRRGDRIRVSTAEGTFTYVVRETRVVAASDVSVLDPTPDHTLTLVTCYPFNYIGTAPKRFVVRATRNSELRTQNSESW